jgi:hypothetical protein
MTIAASGGARAGAHVLTMGANDAQENRKIPVGSFAFAEGWRSAAPDPATRPSRSDAPAAVVRMAAVLVAPGIGISEWSLSNIRILLRFAPAYIASAAGS